MAKPNGEGERGGGGEGKEKISPRTPRSLPLCYVSLLRAKRPQWQIARRNGCFHRLPLCAHQIVEKKKKTKTVPVCEQLRGGCHF